MTEKRNLKEKKKSYKKKQKAKVEKDVAFGWSTVHVETPCRIQFAKPQKEVGKLEEDANKKMKKGYA